MTDPQPEPPRPGRAATVLMVIAGIVLLLPGLCVAITAIMTLRSVVEELWLMLTSERRGDPSEWYLLAFWVIFWAVCLGISYLGYRLIRRAIR